MKEKVDVVSNYYAYQLINSAEQKIYISYIEVLSNKYERVINMRANSIVKEQLQQREDWLKDEPLLKAAIERDGWEKFHVNTVSVYESREEAKDKKADLINRCRSLFPNILYNV